MRFPPAGDGWVVQTIQLAISGLSASLFGNERLLATIISAQLAPVVGCEVVVAERECLPQPTALIPIGQFKVLCVRAQFPWTKSSAWMRIQGRSAV